MVDDEFLNRLGLEKGTRKVVYHEERGRVLRAMDGCSYKAAAGGSLSNSLVALARLGGQPIGGPALNIAMTGSVGSDPLGGFYRYTSFLAFSLNLDGSSVEEFTSFSLAFTLLRVDLLQIKQLYLAVHCSFKPKTPSKPKRCFYAST